MNYKLTIGVERKEDNLEHKASYTTFLTDKKEYIRYDIKDFKCKLPLLLKEFKKQMKRYTSYNCSRVSFDMYIQRFDSEFRPVDCVFRIGVYDSECYFQEYGKKQQTVKNTYNKNKLAFTYKEIEAMCRQGFVEAMKAKDQDKK